MRVSYATGGVISSLVEEALSAVRRWSNVAGFSNNVISPTIERYYGEDKQARLEILLAGQGGEQGAGTLKMVRSLDTLARERKND